MFDWLFKKKKHQHECNCPKVLVLTKQDILDWKKIKSFKDLSNLTNFKTSIENIQTFDVVMFVSDEVTYLVKNRWGKQGIVLDINDIKRIQEIDEKVKTLNLDLPHINLDNV